MAAALSLAACGGGSAVPRTTPSTTRPPTATGPTTSTAPPVPVLALRPGEWRVSLGLPHGSYRPSAPNGGTDDYRCFLVDPHLTSAAYVTGLDFEPGNPQIVHHAVLYRVAPAQVPAAQAKDEASGGRGWTCFGDPGLPPTGGGATAVLDSAPWLGAWAPGTGEQLFPAGTGVPVAAGSRIVLQVHYNLRQHQGTDNSHVVLRLAPGRAHLRALRTQLLVAPVELPCAAGQTGPLCSRDAALADLVSRFGVQAAFTVAGLQLLCAHGTHLARAPGPTQSCDRTVRTRTTVVAAAGHMHLLGRSITIVLDPGTPRERVLFDRPVWNFDDQRATVLPRPVTLRPGDTLRLTCTHDATLRDRLPELDGLPNRYVLWGAGTTDEMCLGLLLETD